MAKQRAPSIIDERVLPPALDEIAEYTGEIMGKLTYLDADDEQATVMAHGIIYDRLLSELQDQLKKIMHREANRRIKKLFPKK